MSFDGDELVLLVAGQEVTIPLDAEAKIKGDLEEGSWVEVEAVVEDGSFLAIEIEVDKDKDKDKGEDDEDEDEAIEDEEEGEDKDKGKGKDKGKERKN